MVSKKILSFLLAGTLAVSMGSVCAFAASASDIPVCDISGCTQTVDHRHNGKTYTAHTANDGHTYHNNCGVSGCTRTGEHTSHSTKRAGGGHHSHGAGSHHQ